MWSGFERLQQITSVVYCYQIRPLQQGNRTHAANPAKDATSSAGVKADSRPRAGTEETRARSGFQPMRCADFSCLWGGARDLKHSSGWGERLLVGGRSNLPSLKKARFPAPHPDLSLMNSPTVSVMDLKRPRKA